MKAVFFDAGGTLVHIDYPRVARIVSGALGRAVDPASLAADVPAFCRELVSASAAA